MRVLGGEMTKPNQTRYIIVLVRVEHLLAGCCWVWEGVSIITATQ